MNKIKKEKIISDKNNMSNSNIFTENNNNPLNILQNQSSKNNIQESLKIPKNIGPYEIITKLKDGCYSKIYLAKSKYTGDNVCIKLIEKSSFQENVEELLLVTRQIETLKILKHRNILSLIEIYESPNFIFLVTEYLSGKNLIEHLIDKKRFNEDDAKKIFFYLIDALYYMHKMNICHRDIRTEHILFDKNKIPKIIGFSYSTFYIKNQKLKDSFGSLCYACPEIIQENPYDPELSDVWSLGVVLYVLVCGYLPFSEENDEKNKDLIIRGKVEYPKEISNKLKDLLRHMLDIDSKKRYNFNKIMKHPWFKPFSENLLNGGCNVYKMIYPVDERILNIIQIYNFKKKDIERDMKNNKFNIGTGLYRHLAIKLNEMGYKNISDFESKEFSLYKKEKNNYYKDGDKRFNDYLNSVQEKIGKIEKLISDFQEKQENIINQLHNIEEMNLSLRKSNSSSNISDTNTLNALSDNNSEKSDGNKNYNENIKVNKFNNINRNEGNGILKTTNKKICHRRTLTPMFGFKELDDNEIIDTEIGHINKDEIEIINKSKKKEKRRDIIFNINKELKFNTKDNNNYNPKLKHSKSCQNIKNFVTQLLNSKKRNSYKNRYSKNLDITKRIDDTHNNITNITTSYSKWRDTSMIIKRKKNYLNCSSFLDSYLKKTHPDNMRRNDVKNSLINDINQIIIEENNNNSIINNSGDTSNNNGNNEIRKSRQIKYSLSFGDDDDDEDESSYISKIDSKQVSIYDIDEELKVLKEMGNNKSPNLKGNNNNNIGNNKFISNFNEKNQNLFFNSNKNIGFRNSKNLKKLRNSNTYINNKENKNELNNIQSKISFNIEDINKNTNKNNIVNTFTNNNNNNIIRCNSNVENNNKINNNWNNENRNDNNPIFKTISYNLNKKTELKDFTPFYRDKKNISKLHLINNEDLLSINFIYTKEKNKYLYSYFRDHNIIKRMKIEKEKEDFCNIEDIDKMRPHRGGILKIKENDKNKYCNRNCNSKYIQKKTFDMAKTNKDKNVVIIENNNTTRKNYHNSKEILNNNGYVKNSNLKTKCYNQNNNNLTSKKPYRRESIKTNNDLIDNIDTKLEKENNKKLNKNIKFQDNLNNNKNNNRNKPIKNTKLQKSKNKDLNNNKYHEELNFTNISDISEIKALSILSPSYMNTNVDNKIQSINDNKENILFNNFLQNKSNFISFDKSFQSQSQSLIYQNPNSNKPKYLISNLSVSHENNIICEGNTNKKNREKNKNNNSKNRFKKLNGNTKVKKIIDNSNSNINLEDIINNSSNNNSYSYINLLNNFDNCATKINNYKNKNENINNINYLDKNNYNNNYIVTIKKRNLAEKLKEEIQKSFNKSSIGSSSLIFNNNGKLNIETSINKDNIDYNFNNNSNNPITYNENIPQSNGKTIREKIMRCSSMVTKNNKNNKINENNLFSERQNKFIKSYNHIPMHQYDINKSQYVTQYININNTNANLNRNININNSINSINNQTEFIDNFNINVKDNSEDNLFSSLQTETKSEEYKKPPQRKSTIKIKKKLSKSVVCDNGIRNKSVNHVIYVNRSRKKSNGKTNIHSININNDSNRNITTTTTKSANINYKAKKESLLQNIKYKCLNGKQKNIDLSNNNVIILSKHKKNYDCNNLPNKFITCSFPDLKSNNSQKNKNTNSKKDNTTLSLFNLHKNKKHNKGINKKASFKNGEINNKYRKKNSMCNININTDLNNNKNINNDKDKKALYKKNNNVTHRSSMNLYNNIGKSKKVISNKGNKEESTKKKEREKIENISPNKKEGKKSERDYRKALFI